MVSRSIIISAAILLLGTATFANSLENDNGDSTQNLKLASFHPSKRGEALGGLLNNGLSAHETQLNTPQPNALTASNPNSAQENSGTPTSPKPQDSDEQAGDKPDEGDDQPDVLGQGEAKRSVETSPFQMKRRTPGSSVTRRAIQPPFELDDDDNDENRSDDDDALEDMEDNETNSREAKRSLKFRRRLSKKRDIDRFIQKTQLGVDMLNAKANKFVDKIVGSSDDTKSSDLPDGHSISKANDAVSHAKSISSSAIEGNMKAIHDTL